jgi:hypothetical protein
MAASAPVSVVTVVAVGALLPDQRTLALVAVLWLTASMFAAAGQRMAFRFLPPQASLASIVVIPVVVTAAIATSTSVGNFTLVTLLCAYASIDALVGTALNAALRDRIMTSIAAGVTLGIGAIWILSVS